MEASNPSNLLVHDSDWRGIRGADSVHFGPPGSISGREQPRMWLCSQERKVPGPGARMLGAGALQTTGIHPPGGHQCCCHRGPSWFSPSLLGSGAWGAWSPWTGCTVSCGGGMRSRMRACDSPAPQGGGDYCEGPPTQLEACGLNPCPGELVVGQGRPCLLLRRRLWLRGSLRGRKEHEGLQSGSRLCPGKRR